MHLRHSLRSIVLFVALAGTLAAAAAEAATQVWSGRTFAFSKAANVDPTQAANQDRITPLVWITRGTTMGIFNAFSEASYSHFLSPVGTQWATGDAADYETLPFADWETWALALGGPPAMVGLNACVHLINEDIYLDIVFDSWQAGVGGAFSYHRAVAPQETAIGRSTWGAIKRLYH